MRYRFLRFPEGKAKAVTFSYDDGVTHDIKLAEILSQYGMKGTFNVCSRLFGDNEGGYFLTKGEMEKYILQKGHEIAVHGADHRAPGMQRPIDVIQEFLDCRRELEEAFEIIIRGMAYPDSGITSFCSGASTLDNIRQTLQNIDIAYARTLGGDNDSFQLPTDWHQWMPTAHHDNPVVFEYIKKFLEIDVEHAYAAGRTPKLFYLWGHSFEFERNHNWEHLVQICEAIGNQPDVWYATNMEIYDYVSAYHSLVYSANGKIVYNPSLVTVWFDVDGRLYAVKSGETIRIE